jgi:hypothetical protein
VNLYRTTQRHIPEHSTLRFSFVFKWAMVSSILLPVESVIKAATPMLQSDLCLRKSLLLK